MADTAASYSKITFNGLGLLQQALVPHLSPLGHLETSALTEVAERYDREHQPYWALRNGQALLVGGSDSIVA